MEEEKRGTDSVRRTTRSRRTRGVRDTTFQTGTNARKLLPSLALGVLITVLAALFNAGIYGRRLPAMVVGNRIFESEAAAEYGLRRPNTALGRALRILAGLVNITDDLVTDAMYAARGPGDFPSTADRIAVIAIDEASILRRGSWPWSRCDIARILERAADARVVGIDLTFNDSDRTSLTNYVERFESLYGVDLPEESIDREVLDNDVYLARRIAGTNTVLGAILYNGSQPLNVPPRPDIAHSIAIDSRGGSVVEPQDLLLRQAQHVLTDIPEIRESGPVGEGFVNLFPAPNGAIRSVPLFAHLPDGAFAFPSAQNRIVYPSLALEMMRANLGGDAYTIGVRGDKVHIPEMMDPEGGGDRYPVRDVAIVGRDGDGERELLRIPLNELGEMELALRSHRDGYTVYPAWEVLEGRHEGAFTDKLVLLGGTGEGVGFVVSAGMSAAEMSAVETHAAMLSAMLKGDFMESGYQDDYSWQQIAILASGLAVTVAIIFGSLGLGIYVSAFSLLGILLVNYFLFFRRGVSAGVTLPLLSTLAVLAVLVVTNYLVVGRERRFIRKAFSLNVSPSILGYLETHPDRLSSLQGENRHMTVMFTDIRGFTSISERMTAPDLARFLNEYFTPMSDIVMRNMGTVDKFIGDGLMAFWNAPADNPDHCADAARAALDMLDKLGELQAGWTGRGLPRISIGCGINTGPMFAGYMGSEQRKNYTVMGDNVNIASRLENLNKLYASSILITESTRRELGDEFLCRVVDKARISGKETTVLIYELLGCGPASDEQYEEFAAFARVFELYQEREFAAAESLLKELVFIRPTPLYKMYLDRLAVYKALPPPPNWDGTFSKLGK